MKSVPKSSLFFFVLNNAAEEEYQMNCTARLHELITDEPMLLKQSDGSNGRFCVALYTQYFVAIFQIDIPGIHQKSVQAFGYYLDIFFTFYRSLKNVNHIDFNFFVC